MYKSASIRGTMQLIEIAGISACLLDIGDVDGIASIKIYMRTFEKFFKLREIFCASQNAMRIARLNYLF